MIFDHEANVGNAGVAEIAKGEIAESITSEEAGAA
jgi:hypothetical protein